MHIVLGSSAVQSVWQMSLVSDYGLEKKHLQEEYSKPASLV